MKTTHVQSIREKENGNDTGFRAKEAVSASSSLVMLSIQTQQQPPCIHVRATDMLMVQVYCKNQ